MSAFDYVCVFVAVGGEMAFTAREKKRFLSLVVVIYLVVVCQQFMACSSQVTRKLVPFASLLGMQYTGLDLA